MNNENYLSDWLADKITDDQLKQLVSEDDFFAYQKLKLSLQNFSLSEPDLESNFKAIQHKINLKKETPTKKVIPIWNYISIAASFLLFFGLYQIYFSSNEFKTQYGVSKNIVMNDQSSITLNANSSISYPNLFKFNRTIKLEGEAFFEVQKGSTFKVNTILGNVTVLGTKFNVACFDDFFEVTCYEGKVQVDVNSKSIVLTKGESVRMLDSKVENWGTNTPEKPKWVFGESSFKNTPIKYVIEKFKNQYGVKVNYPKEIETVKFTGTFTNNDKVKALKSICIPLELNYSDNNSNTILISK